MNLTPAELEQYLERVAIIMEGAALCESDASKLAMEGVIASRIARMSAGSGREQARALVRELRQ